MAVRLNNNRLRSLVIFLFSISDVVRPILAVNMKNDDTVILNDAAESEIAMLQPMENRHVLRNEKIDPEIGSRSLPTTSADSSSEDAEMHSKKFKGIQKNRKNDESTHVQDIYPEPINGGKPAATSKWPWMAALIRPTGEFFCGGTLIDNEHILTAGHCFRSVSSMNVPYVTVRLGDYNIETNDEVRHTERRINRLVQHPNYSVIEDFYAFNDVAILTMDAPVQFTRAIKPIRLPSGSQSYAGKTATAIGWGSSELFGRPSAVLQEVTLPIWENSECKQLYDESEKYKNSIRDSSLCAGIVGKSLCLGDSGGPLVVYDGEWIQIGISSWLDTCGTNKFPSVFARVSYFVPWIYENLK